jgi:hypothetical protein
MTEMRFAEFKRIVLEEMEYIKGFGYYLSTDKKRVPPQHLHLGKSPAENVDCIIEFQLKQIYSPPMREFNVRLLRYHTPMDSELYPPIGATLRGLVSLGYGVDIFPKDKFLWEFTNAEELRAELMHARYYLDKYGIKWLEDPTSTVFWRESVPKDNS